MPKDKQISSEKSIFTRPAVTMTAANLVLRGKNTTYRQLAKKYILKGFLLLTSSWVTNSIYLKPLAPPSKENREGPLKKTLFPFIISQLFLYGSIATYKGILGYLKSYEREKKALTLIRENTALYSENDDGDLVIYNNIETRSSFLLTKSNQFTIKQDKSETYRELPGFVPRHMHFLYKRSYRRSPYGEFHDHPILGDESAFVDSSVFLDGDGLLLVDTDPQAKLEQLYQKVKVERLENLIKAQNKKGVNEIDILLALYESAKFTIPACLEEAEDKLRKILDFIFDKIKPCTKILAWHTELMYEKFLSLHEFDREDFSWVSIEKFIDLGKGVCKHQNIVAAYLIHRAIKDGFLSGEMTIHARASKALNNDGHLWLSYKHNNSSKGENTDFLIIDVTWKVMQYYSKIAAIREFPVFNLFYDKTLQLEPPMKKRTLV